MKIRTVTAAQLAEDRRQMYAEQSLREAFDVLGITECLRLLAEWRKDEI